MKEKYLNLVQMVLDHQLIDANYIECGKVTDIEIEGGPDELRVTALLTGPGVAAGHMPRILQALIRKIFGRRVTRIPWSEVRVITSQIKLGSTAPQLGLNAAEQKVARWLARLPLAK